MQFMLVPNAPISFAFAASKLATLYTKHSVKCIGIRCGMYFVFFFLLFNLIHCYFCISLIFIFESAALNKIFFSVAHEHFSANICFALFSMCDRFVFGVLRCCPFVFTVVVFSFFFIQLEPKQSKKNKQTLIHCYLFWLVTIFPPSGLMFAFLRFCFQLNRFNRGSRKKKSVNCRKFVKCGIKSRINVIMNE